MNKLQDWYNGMAKGQRTFVWLVSAVLAFLGFIAFGYGAALGLVAFIPLILLIYCKLGRRESS